MYLHKHILSMYQYLCSCMLYIWFVCYSNYLLDFNDPLFMKIAVRFIKEVR